MSPVAVAFERIDPHRAPRHDLEGLASVDVAVDRDAELPEPLVVPVERGVLDHRHDASFRVRRVWIARAGDSIAGYAVCIWEDAPSNRDHAFIDVQVAPPHRRHGMGHELLRCVVDEARELGCTLLDAEARAEGPGAAFLGRFGFEARNAMPHNVCWTDHVDRTLMEQWVARAAERAGDYELVGWDGPCPEELLSAYVDLWHVMNTAPTGRLEREDDVMTVAHWRAMEEDWGTRGIVPWTLAARHRESGLLCGFTTLTLHRHWPARAEQEDTGVLPAHRDRGLGRWLKAAMMLRLLDEAPEVKVVSTWNAAQNAPMLNLNHAMGFRPVEEWAEWQGSRSAAAAAVAG